MKGLLAAALFGLVLATAKCGRIKRQDKPKCVCVPYYMCGPDNKIDVWGTDQLDQRIPLDGDPNPVCGGVDICCEIPDEDSKPPKTGGTTEKPSRPIIDPFPPTSRPPAPVTEHPPETGSDVLVPQTPRGLNGCGLKRLNPLDPRILPDNETAIRITGKDGKPENTFFGEFPWMVAVFNEKEGKKNFVCGGSLLAPGVVLTGAHCVHTAEANEVVIRAGDWDSRNANEPIPHQDRTVARISVHKDFDSGNLRNDIALLFLETPFQLSESVDTICIEKDTEHLNKNCYATGWGVNSFSDVGLYQPILKKVYLPLVDRDSCQEQLRSTRLGHYFRLHKSFICAGGLINQDTCTGDGGGPLVCSGVDGNHLRFAQAGIVSWGIGCGANQTPGVYTSVSYFHDWIDSQVSK